MAKRQHKGRAVGRAKEVSPDLSEVPFEKALSELEAIVESLEEGTLSLEDSITRFERGIHLSRHLETQLRRAEQRVRQLVGEEGDESALAPFAEGAQEDGEEEEENGDGEPQLPF